ncbi:hypothetical protein [Streptomyces sp. LaPpAH-108]|uniref:hypothetical protein n=1 Tax=Streptomyces sp. LaPpAH-108 TaxID=1155714 RepID=UPI00035D6AFC|nr:hypothetical protein [Streptomyces sp. LaPpAH-108]
MGTAERREAPEKSVAVRSAPARDRKVPGQAGGTHEYADERTREYAARERPGRYGEGVRPAYRPLWVEEPARRRRLPDPVRTSAVRAVLLISVTLIQAMVAFLCTMAGSWLAFPMVISSVVSTVVATWSVVDVWVTRQVWNQRYGVVSEPSSTARSLRRERRAARRRERAARRDQERIPGRGAAGLSHS